jgi:molecular chaperone DnaK (HSP70)
MIIALSGLSDEEIKCMVVDVEHYAEQDKARRDIIEELNKAKSVCANTEKGENTVSTSQFECKIKGTSIANQERDHVALKLDPHTHQAQPPKHIFVVIQPAIA